jgi:hypothetical protein
VVEANRVYVIGQIRDLRDWVLFVRDSLQADRPFEKGKLAMLEAYMGLEFLKEAERDSLALARRLEQIIRAIESSVLPAQQAGILSR